MDPLAAFLDGPRARSAFVLRCVLDPPWSMLVQDEAPLTVVSMLRGHAWFLPCDDAGSPLLGDGLLLGDGDVLITRGSGRYVVADEPATPPNIVIDPAPPGGDHPACRTTDGRDLYDELSLGVRTWGNSATGETVMLVGTYLTDGEVSRVLLDALPQAICLRADDWDSPITSVLADEAVRDLPGQQVVLDRLLDLLLVGALRAAFTGGDVAVPRWYRASSDPVVGQVVKLMQGEPARPWTVGSLASAVGVSRALLARRFHEIVGEPPMAFLTAWRMALAADRLLEAGATVGAVAREVGYGSPFTFSTAFKRHHGTSPRDYRLAHSQAPGVSPVQQKRRENGTARGYRR